MRKNKAEDGANPAAVGDAAQAATTAGRDKAAKPDNAVKPAGKKKKLLMLAALGLMMSAGMGGYLMLGSGDAPAEAAKPVEGAVLELSPITINLNDGHYLKVGLALQTTIDVEEEPNGAKALDLAIDQFSEYSMSELASGEGRRGAKEKLREHVTEAYEGEVMDVYFTEFVMQ
jgi:flagellar FliL protein